MNEQRNSKKQTAVEKAIASIKVTVHVGGRFEVTHDTTWFYTRNDALKFAKAVERAIRAAK